MDAMEKGPSARPRVNDSDSNENNEGLDVEYDEEEDQDLYEEFKNGGLYYFLVVLNKWVLGLPQAEGLNYSSAPFGLLSFDHGIWAEPRSSN
uniref:Uncharacterized protein n=1 Tax=Quercus lobata TaxID=97700 RepID=A0A7N2L5C8_QUELO